MDSDFELEQLLSVIRPRRHHYEFAHTTLKLITFSAPGVMRERLGCQDALGRLWRLWDVVGRKLSDDQRLNASGLVLRRLAIGDSDFFAVQLPPALRVTEAHFVGLAFGRRAAEAGTLPVRYFTLEKGMSADGETERTALCEWTSDATGFTHLNFGDGPAVPATAEDFASVVAPLLGEPPEEVHAATSSLKRSLLSRN